MNNNSVRIPFNRPFVAGDEIQNIVHAIDNFHLSGDGTFSRSCERWLERNLGAPKALLTHSCTAALEMAVLLAGVGHGDEVIMPSFTFASTANAVVLRGGVPVFVDIRPDTLNIDENLIEDAITDRTKAIMVVHYAGIGCAMDPILAIARRHGLRVIEDAAQGIDSRYRGRPLGAIGDLGCFSFHETKNIIAGEGGALVINDPALIERAEILREKGTDRAKFYRGEIDKYTWVDVGSSFLPSEIIAAFLAAQLEQSGRINDNRRRIWAAYHEALAPLERAGYLRRPIVPADCDGNAHIYHVIAANPGLRDRLLVAAKAEQIGATFHYVPLHSSPAGRRFGRAHGAMTNTDQLSARLIRLPLWIGMDQTAIGRVAACLRTTSIDAMRTPAAG